MFVILTSSSYVLKNSQVERSYFITHTSTFINFQFKSLSGIATDLNLFGSELNVTTVDLVDVTDSR